MSATFLSLQHFYVCHYILQYRGYFFFYMCYLDKSAANIEGYKLAKRVAKRAVSVAKGKAYDDLYQQLGTKEGEKDIYSIDF